MATEPAAQLTPKLRRERQMALFRRASERLPGGTDSNFRAWGEATIYVDRGEGGYVWDVDGNEYVDLRMGYGPVILGHGDARVDDYVNERMRKGVSFSLTTHWLAGSLRRATSPALSARSTSPTALWWRRSKWPATSPMVGPSGSE